MSWRSYLPRFYAPRINTPRIRPPHIGVGWWISSAAWQLQRALMPIGTVAFLLAAGLFELRVIAANSGLESGGIVTILVNSVPTILLAVLVAAGWWLRWRWRPGWGLTLVFVAAALMGLMLLF
jgi:hypothetical protein